MNGIIKRLAVLGVSAAFSASLAACTEEDIPQLSISKNITLDFGDSFDFGADACKGLKLCSLIPGKCIITSADIDEPEISLHAMWQRIIIDELTKICDRNETQVIVSTHSPEIMRNHLDITIGLDDGDEDDE